MNFLHSQTSTNLHKQNTYTNTQTYAKIQLLKPRLFSLRVVCGDISKVVLYTDS